MKSMQKVVEKLNEVVREIESGYAGERQALVLISEAMDIASAEDLFGTGPEVRSEASRRHRYLQTGARCVLAAELIDRDLGPEALFGSRLAVIEAAGNEAKIALDSGQIDGLDFTGETDLRRLVNFQLRNCVKSYGSGLAGDRSMVRETNLQLQTAIAASLVGVWTIGLEEPAGVS